MDRQDAPRSASAEEEAPIGETPALVVNNVFVSPMAGGAKITFAEARWGPGENAAARVAVFLQHADFAVLQRLLGWTADAAGRPLGGHGGSMH